jgi:hypothetical protein
MLTLASLRKYKRVHRLRVKPTVSKAELVDVVSAHFAGLPAALNDEEKVIDGFVTAVRQRRSDVEGEGNGHGVKGLKKASNRKGVKRKQQKRGGKVTSSPSSSSSPSSDS